MDPAFDFQLLWSSLTIVAVMVLVSQGLARRRDHSDKWK